MLPALNTFLLLSSGVTLTWAHAEIIAGNRLKAIKGVFFTLFLALAFTGCQFIEYKYSDLHINDSTYGSIFYLVTGFHGFHVIIGTIFIFVCLLRMLSKRHITFTRQHHFGFVAAL
jgi:cytochrome c oxidase subunit 3